MAATERSIRTPAIILRRHNRGEADRALTILTPGYGKFEVIAYGARKPASRKTGHVELFMLVDMLINRRKDPGTVTQAEMMEPFLPMREDMLLGAYANYIVELLDRFTERDDLDTASQVFDLLRDTLARLCVEDDKRLVLRYYEMHLLNIVGFRPELQHCTLTGETVLPENQFFSFSDGGVVSHDAGARNPNLPNLSFHALKLMRHLQRSQWRQVAALKLNDRLHIEVEALMLGYITYTLESQLQSVEFIRKLRRAT